jgi:hypothetical protein
VENLFAVKIAVLRLEELLLLDVANGKPKPNAGIYTMHRKKPIAVVAVISFGAKVAQIRMVVAPISKIK